MKRETKIDTRQTQAPSEGSFWELCIFALFFVVVFTVVARSAHAAPAQGAAPAVAPVAATSPRANVNAVLPEQTTAKRYVFSSTLVIDTSGTLAPTQNEERSYSGEYVLKTGVTDQKTNLSLSLKAGYAREYTFELEDGTDGDLVDPAIALTKTWKEGQDFRSPVFDTIVLGLGGVVGASNESARGTFVGSLGPSIAVTKQIHKLGLGQKFGYSRRFYNYDIRNDGTVNAPDSFSSTTDLSFNLTEKLALSAQTILSYAINFQGTGVTQEISAFSLDWTITPALATSLGVATKRGTISDDGTSNQVKFVDASVAQGFFDLILNF